MKFKLMIATCAAVFVLAGCGQGTETADKPATQLQAPRSSGQRDTNGDGVTNAVPLVYELDISGMT